jgi:hypothetical protein
VNLEKRSAFFADSAGIGAIWRAAACGRFFMAHKFI